MVALFMVVLGSQWDRVNPISWAFSRFSTGVALVGDLGVRIEPEIVIVMTPVASDTAQDAAQDATQNAAAGAETAAGAADTSVVALAILTPTVSSAAAGPAADAPDNAVEQTQVISVEATPVGAETGETAAALAPATSTVPVGSLGVGGARQEEINPSPAAPSPTALPTATAQPTETPTPVPTATSEPTATWTPRASIPTAAPTDAPTAAPVMGLAAALGGQPASESAAESGAESTATRQNDAPQNGVVVALVPTATSVPSGESASAGVAQVAGVQAPATAAASPTPVVYEIVTGDTLVGIASRFGVTVEALMDANGIASRDVYEIQPGQLLIIPVTAADENLPAVPTPSIKYYQVRPGDTLVSIAAQHDVTVDALMAANSMSTGDVGSLQPGRLLTIPSTDAADSETDGAGAEGATANTPTVNTPAATPTSAAERALRLDAPVLLGPEDGASIRCADSEQLTWQSVRFMRDTDKFLLHLGFVSGRTGDGTEQVTWVLAQPRPATTASWEMDPTLCGLAPQAFGRQWRWWVEVVEEVEGELRPVSLPSVQRKFSWK